MGVEHLAVDFVFLLLLFFSHCDFVFHHSLLEISLLEHALVLVVVLPGEYPFSIELVVGEIALVFPTVLEDVTPLAMSLVIGELSLIHVSVGVLQLSMSVELVELKLALVNHPAFPVENSVSVVLVLAPRAIVDQSQGLKVEDFSFNFLTLLEMAFIEDSCGEGLVTKALFFVVFELSNIVLSVCEVDDHPPGEYVLLLLSKADVVIALELLGVRDSERVKELLDSSGVLVFVLFEITLEVLQNFHCQGILESFHYSLLIWTQGKLIMGITNSTQKWKGDWSRGRLWTRDPLEWT